MPSRSFLSYLKDTFSNKSYKEYVDLSKEIIDLENIIKDGLESIKNSQQEIANSLADLTNHIQASSKKNVHDCRNCKKVKQISGSYDEKASTC